MPAFSLPALLRAVAVWLLIMAAETAQGALRRVLTHPDVEFVVRQASVLTGVLVIFVIAWFSLRWVRLRTAGGALTVGLLWAVLTVIFELALGRATGLSWARLREDYDLLGGGMMPLGLAAMAVTPWIVWKLQARRGAPDDTAA